MGTELNELKQWLKIMYLVFTIGPWRFKVVFASAAIVFICGLNISLIWPIIFNNLIIPNIEKKIGKPIIFPLYIKYLVLGHFMFRYILIARYISFEYLKSRFNPNYYKHKYEIYKWPNYPIKEATKFEIIMSLTTLTNQALIVLGLIGIFAATGKYLYVIGIPLFLIIMYLTR